MSDCIFCRIAEGSIPAKVVHQDDQAVAFEDLNPQAPVHILVIPRKHVASIGESNAADADLLGKLMLTCARIAKERGLTPAGYRVVMNTGPDAGQSVFHLHLHVLGGRAMAWPPG